MKAMIRTLVRNGNFGVFLLVFEPEDDTFLMWLVIKDLEVLDHV